MAMTRPAAPTTIGAVVHRQLLSADECAPLRNQAEAADERALSGEHAQMQAGRRCSVVEPDDVDAGWLGLRIEGLMRSANNTTFGFELDGIDEPPNLIHYRPGDHHDWHVDTGPGWFARRKLTLVVALSPAAAYRGGMLETHRSCTDIPRLDCGDAVVFPSIIPHRVTPVLRGSRASMIAWMHGEPLR